MKTFQILGALGAALLFSALARANDGPDITVLRIAGDTDDYHFWGVDGSIAAYSFGTTSCNRGTEEVQWTPDDHPVIGQNIFRLRNGYFEHIGQSWLKHGFCAVNEPGCGFCQVTPCPTLGIGCADTYNSGLNDGIAGGPKFEVDPTSGVHPDPHAVATGPSMIRGRLQVRIVDIDPTLPENAGAQWIAEGQYVSAHDAQNLNALNNNSWQRIAVLGFTDLRTGGATNEGEPGIVAWRAFDPEVLLDMVVNVDEGGPGIHGYYWVGSRVSDLGGGNWRYVYAVQNLTSKQSGASVTIPVDDQITAGNFYFHDVDYHSGEPYDGTDWSATHASGAVRVACTQTFQQNPNANALRWGTLYTFAFDCDSPPRITSTSELGLFEPGSGTVLGFEAFVPGGDPPVGTAYCFGDGTDAFCPCFNFGEVGHGCGNGTFDGGAKLTATGNPSVSADDVTLWVVRAAPSESGLFFQGDIATGGGGGVPFGDGLRCASVNVVRLESVITGVGGNSASSVAIGATAGLNAGDVRRYQHWYRDPSLSPCGAGFNLTNGIEIAWAP